jgi:Uma2 family endonuclease
MINLQTLSKKESSHSLYMSYEAYLAEDWDNHLAEWVNGEVIIHMPASNEHQSIVGFLLSLLREFVTLLDLGTVRVAPFEVKLWPNGPSREPDIFFVRKENLHRLTSKRFEGAPDLIIEVISVGSVQRDRDKKFQEYAQAGVPEYWILDSRPGRHRADFFGLNESGNYELIATEDEERVESTMIEGFWLNPSWLWQEKFPKVITLIYNMSPETAAAVQTRLLSSNE